MTQEALTAGVISPFSDLKRRLADPVRAFGIGR
jgi:hypothetical protein